MMDNSVRKIETGLSLSSYLVQQNIAFHLSSYYIHVSGLFTNVVGRLILSETKEGICFKRELNFESKVSKHSFWTARWLLFLQGAK